MTARPEVAWSDRFGLLIRWPAKDPYWFYGPVFRGIGATATHGPQLPDDAVMLEPKVEEPTS